MVIPIFSIFILQFVIDSITLNAEHTNYDAYETINAYKDLATTLQNIDDAVLILDTIA